MKRSDQLITAIRRAAGIDTGNSTTQGISDELVLSWLNDAQDRIQSLLINQYSRSFDTTAEESLVASKRDYSLPADAMLGNRVRRVEYSDTGDADDYRPLEKIPEFYHTTAEGIPRGYTVVNGSVWLTPTPDVAKGKIRISYPRRLDNVDIRRGKITTINDDGTDYTTMILADDSDLDATALADADYLCVNDRYGTVNYYNLQVDNYNSGTRTVTFEDGMVMTGGTISTDEYITIGRYTTTHPALDDIFERYLIAYGVLEANWKLESAASVQAESRLVGIQNDIIALHQRQGDDVELIPECYEFYP